MKNNFDLVEDFDWEEEFNLESGFVTETVPGNMYAEELPKASYKEVLEELVVLASESVTPFLYEHQYQKGECETDCFLLVKVFMEYKSFCEEFDITPISIFAFSMCLQEKNIEVGRRDSQIFVYLKQVN